MALLSFRALPIVMTQMFPPQQIKFSSLAMKSSAKVPYQFKASHTLADTATPTIRSEFKPSIWTYDYIQSLSSEYKEEKIAEQTRGLREEVRMLFGKLKNSLDGLELINELQRLGVAYHFSNEIKNVLDNIHNMNAFQRKENLHATALEFRLLRQHGYEISTDVFICFQDEKGGFKTGEYDVEGMLLLYEASFCSFEGETILDEGRDFTSQFLKEYLGQNKSDYISLLISHAFEFPLHWRIPRWEVQWFINAYETKQSMNPTLLQLAKLDFNYIQAIYQDDLKYASRWWKGTGLVDKLSLVRDRLVECFTWTVGMSFMPHHGYFRRALAKINALITTIDDIYELYGNLDELQLFTDAIERWDINALESLPDNMKICFHVLYNFVNDTSFEALKETGYYITPYLKKTLADLCKAYLTEAKWLYNGYTPSLEEYLENGWISVGAPVMIIHTFFLIPHSFQKEDLTLLGEYPDIVRFSAMIIRLANDLGSYKREKETTGDVSYKSIQCYMHKTGSSEEVACDHIKSMLNTTWKKMNKAASDSSFSQSFKEIVMNVARMSLCMYQHGDGHTTQDLEIKDLILSLIVQPIPVITSSEN